MKKAQSKPIDTDVIPNNPICPNCNNWGFTTVLTSETLPDGTTKPGVVQIKECTCEYGLNNVYVNGHI